MRDSVKAAVNAFNDRFEGHLPYMYTDCKGLVTTGRGNLVDPLSVALALPWQMSDGSTASKAAVTAAWLAVKGAWPHVSSVNCRALTIIRLSEDAIDTLCLAKLAEDEAFLRTRYPAYDSWPAPAQLGILSMSWAMGPGFNFPAFRTAANAGDWATAAANCSINSAGNPGVIPRNVANHKLFLAASVSTDPDTLGLC